MGAAAASPALRSLCVFCGSKLGSKPQYEAAALALGQEMLRRGIALVYGGGDVGLMGVVSRSVREGGGRVTGVIPAKLAPREVSGVVASDTIVVDTMHERKALMALKADAFLALPGGVGTLEELLEMGPWLQLGMSTKPVGILNVEGYYTGLLSQLATSTSEGFTSATTILTVEDSVCELLDALERAAVARNGASLSDIAM